MASQNAVKRAQNTRLAVARSSLTISLTIPWATLDMADEAGGFKVILLSHGFVPANILRWTKGLDSYPRGFRCFRTVRMSAVNLVRLPILPII
jgi:hypothetical protein